MTNPPHKTPRLLEAFIPIIFLIVFLFFNVFFVFKDDSLAGSNQLILLFSAAVAGSIAVFRLKTKWKTLQEGMVKSISAALASMIILLIIGALAGTWLISGIVPAMIYYGLDLINPSVFLVAACLVSAVVSVATGSSWTTVATIGIALLGIGKAMGLPEGMVAGAIISGSYFGDKMSPMSDTTNLAPAMAGTDLFTHIRSMTRTTIPTISVTLLIFLIIGLTRDFSTASIPVKNLQSAITHKFTITPWLFLVPAAVLIMIVKKMPAIPALLAGAIMGGIFAAIFQPDIVLEAAGETNSDSPNSQTLYKGIMTALYTDVSIATPNKQVNELLSTSGMAGMLNTIWLIMSAMIFGGIMEASGMLQRITQSIIGAVHSTGSLIASTVVTCGFFNITASDQYLAIVVPGRMFADTYRKRGIRPEILSRSLEDAGTVTSVLVPWNTCGAYQSGVLGVATGSYLPYCFFNILSPVVNILWGYLFVKADLLPKESEKEMAQVKI